MIASQLTALAPVPAASGGGSRPLIVLVIPRGEAVRNFLYSRTLSSLAARARVTLLSVVDDPDFIRRFEPDVEEVVPLAESPLSPSVARLRSLVENAHDRRHWSQVHQNNWRLRDQRAREDGRRLQRLVIKGLSRLLANEPSLRALTRLEQSLTYRTRPSRDLDRLFERLAPDLVFNGSHIHGMAGELPLRVAHAMGIPTAGFIFSWDNLTSRSRIMVPYDHYLVWHRGMSDQLLSNYPALEPEQVTVTGTPQFDFHFQPELELSREDLCARVGVDAQRPYVLYTTGISNHFFEEHRHVEAVIEMLARRAPPGRRPQLVVRTYVKGTSDEMLAIRDRGYPDVVFPEVLWEPRWQTPRYEDLPIYSNLLRHCALGINAASTVSLELLMLDRPVINLDFDPPGTDLPWDLGYQRHILFDHYKPVAESGAVMVARSNADLETMIGRGLEQPAELAVARQQLLQAMFGAGPLDGSDRGGSAQTLDGHSGERVAAALLDLASQPSAAGRR